MTNFKELQELAKDFGSNTRKSAYIIGVSGKSLLKAIEKEQE